MPQPGTSVGSLGCKNEFTCSTKSSMKTFSEKNAPIFRIAYSHGVGPNLLRQTLLEMGMTEFDETVHDKFQWNLWWKGYRFKEDELSCLNESQRVNHHPTPVGRQADIIHKDGLLRAIRRMCATYPKCANLLLYPMTYHLPREENLFVKAFLQNSHDKAKKLASLKISLARVGDNGLSDAEQQTDSLKSSSQDHFYDSVSEQSNIWILKPADQSRGKGIFLFDRLDDLVYLTKSVVQRYITNPLLIFGHKFDLRLYAVVPSYAPFIVYIHSDGLVRFATERFKLDNLQNVYSHLTNSSINVNGPQYLVNKTGIGRGCKWTVKQFRRWMHEQLFDDRLLWIRIQVLIVLTLLSQASSIPKVPNAYELFGFDILIDSQMRPWLIEVNANPSLSCDCLIDEMVKKPLLTSVLEMLQLNMSVDRYGINGRYLENSMPSAIRIEPHVAAQIPGKMSALDKTWNVRDQQKASLGGETTWNCKETACQPGEADAGVSSNTTAKVTTTKAVTSENLLFPKCQQSTNQMVSLKNPSIYADEPARSTKHRKPHMCKETLDQNRTVLKQRNLIPNCDTCPLYGRGSERLVPRLVALGHRYPTLLQPEKWASQSFSPSESLSLSQTRVKPYCEVSPIKHVKDAYFKSILAPLPLEDDPTGIHLIPLRFGQLKLAFPFNLITRIACAKERGAYPDVKLIVRAANRLVCHVVRITKTNEPGMDESVMDISPVWSNLL
ncbi:hypothetical protein FGIG_09172 [Fasciola gigantica]|uniref:Tubulin polyglutamylase TTLL2 n=1 Tax=Fasciola gigantica TaxID=46835 RepID=A0A504YV28_FASGI|nr:hypothetical protein FGIG_09172 [Fasciola gigantica]